MCAWCTKSAPQKLSLTFYDRINTALWQLMAGVERETFVHSFVLFLRIVRIINRLTLSSDDCCVCVIIIVRRCWSTSECNVQHNKYVFRRHRASGRFILISLFCDSRWYRLKTVMTQKNNNDKRKTLPLNGLVLYLIIMDNKIFKTILFVFFFVNCLFSPPKCHLNHSVTVTSLFGQLFPVM